MHPLVRLGVGKALVVGGSVVASGAFLLHDHATNRRFPGYGEEIRSCVWCLTAECVRSLPQPTVSSSFPGGLHSPRVADVLDSVPHDGTLTTLR